MCSNANFIQDHEKMVDFLRLSKEDFLKSYSYLTNDEYENTRRIFNKRCTIEWCPNCEEEVVIFSDRVQKCPNCGDRIFPCSACEERTCRNCPLD